MMKMEGAQERPQIKGAHKMSLMNRRTGSITGVSDVISFDISEVLLETDMGMLKITGADLHVNRLSLERGGLIWRAGSTVSSILRSPILRRAARRF